MRLLGVDMDYLRLGFPPAPLRALFFLGDSLTSLPDLVWE